MTLLFVGLAMIALMAYIIRQLHLYLSPERFQKIVLPLIPTYLLFNLVFTLFTRAQGEYPIVLVPFRAYIQSLGWDIRSFAELGQLLGGESEASAAPSMAPLIGAAQNIILFLPFGFLLSAAYRRMSTIKILAIGFMLSLFIEVCQLVFKLGWFEMDDILHNVIGTYVGIILYKWVVK